MKNSTQVMAYAQGFLEATIGSVRDYTADDLRRRMQIVVKILRGEHGDDEYLALMAKDAERQAILDGESQSLM